MRTDGFMGDLGQEDEEKSFYRVRVKKGWFRGKEVFSQRLNFYERMLTKERQVVMPLNAGNMIYAMMQRLDRGADWDSQSALMLAYRNLVYRLSYVTAVWYQDDVKCICFEGQKSDVMWTITFISQVYFDEPMVCIAEQVGSMQDMRGFAIQNGTYVGNNTRMAPGDELPDIWEQDERRVSSAITEESITYSPLVIPADGDRFAIPDGRVAEYMRMDARFVVAKRKGPNSSSLERHNITASTIKDFEDMVSSQRGMSQETYQLRYTAFMNKVHSLENFLGGLEPTAYDVLPIAERGLPLAPVDTITRTNAMDCNSLRYIYDSVSQGPMEPDDRRTVSRTAAQSVMMRQSGYEMEYRMYVQTGTPDAIAKDLFRKNMAALYSDFARLDALKILGFPKIVYRDLCNVPSSGGPIMSEWERRRIQLFGKGYLEFLNTKIKAGNRDPDARTWLAARKMLDARYLKAPAKKAGTAGAKPS